MSFSVGLAVRGGGILVRGSSADDVGATSGWRGGIGGGAVLDRERAPNVGGDEERGDLRREGGEFVVGMRSKSDSESGGDDIALMRSPYLKEDG